MNKFIPSNDPVLLFDGLSTTWVKFRSITGGVAYFEQFANTKLIGKRLDQYGKSWWINEVNTPVNISSSTRIERNGAVVFKDGQILCGGKPTYYYVPMDQLTSENKVVFYETEQRAKSTNRGEVVPARQTIEFALKERTFGKR